ncbi:cystathionine beta-lyase [Parvularcula sp. LCG005]|uniref:cystathionine beta-lyase n=1 Tax=Parvularcula sp. LCG005 TaxID=3078805 RepID=UPI0029431152|nr:cystathionine beta-lyase [Parvularcula sp. LCG005]WOI54662.1 cystathionine beta-lyase [Parvularcula sp. LCG005]
MKGPTKDSHVGRPCDGQRLVNPSVDCGSTVLFADYDTFRGRKTNFFYGRAGTATHRAFEQSLCDLEGAVTAELTGSGLAAVALAILSVVKSGDHLLITDSVYDPTRYFAAGHLRDMGVETSFFDPQIGAGIADQIRPNTAAIFCESPGSLTFEVQDLKAIISAAGDIPVLVDNTYAAGVYLKPLAMGAALSIQAITKYIGGHSDLLMGAVMSRDDTIAEKVQKTARSLGLSVSGRDVALAHRGLRTLHRRLAVHQENGLALARWLEARPEIAAVIHPGLPSHPGHDIWAAQATGTTGLFSVIADWTDDATTGRFIDALGLYGLGYSWGGYESLCLPAWPGTYRSAVPWTEKRQLLRFHAGLEDIGDLTADLERGFDRAING